jgi:3-oxoacyl-(acyl-carrier-protein) synthase/3-hydroxymyristoyl/3-hydroxydecanoyl-(acyl carrier protein) dehydratase
VSLRAGARPIPVEPRVAIVGMGGIFPEAPTPRALWDHVAAARDTTRDVPPNRWLLDPEEAFHPEVSRRDHVYSRRGCFIESVPPAAELDLPAELAAGLDPVFVLALEAGRQAFAAGVTEHQDRRRIGVILANIALPTESASILARAWLGRTFAEKAGLEVAPAPFATPPLYGTSLPAAILARALGLGGGSYTLDAACASSLYALKLAADELREGRADAMLAGGVSRPDSLYTQMGFCQLRALSPTGKCRPFDAAADGLVVGEGAGLFLLKRLDDALRDADHILAVITGAGLSNDVGGGLLAPGGDGQVKAMRAAYRQAGWSPTDVDLIECHATGTPVGDAVEFRSLQTLWEGERWQPGQCVIGSVKSTVGHLLTAAGAAAVAKVLGALRAETLPPTANFHAPAPELGYERSPFRVLSQSRAWPRRPGERPRRAAVSGFGFGGVNAHLLLEEWIAPDPSRPRVFLPKLHSQAQTTAATACGDGRGLEIAVVAMEARFGPWPSLELFERRVLGGDDATQARSPRYWWGVEQSEWFRREGLQAEQFAGYYLDGPLKVAADRFRTPPREVRQMLPQQLLMLDVAATALSQLQLSDECRERTGVFLGLGIDLNTTNFHFRWSVLKAARSQAEAQGKAPQEIEKWATDLADAAGPPLTADRTMGALGSVAASRIARVFRFGGPSFTLCAAEASGLRALEVAVRALQRGEIDQALVGAVDLAGDVRAVLAAQGKRQGCPGEGAAAVILQRLEDARAAGNTVLAIIRGIDSAGGSQPGPELESVPDSTGRIARVESAEKEIGHAGAATGLATFVKACLSLNRQTFQRALISSCGGDGGCIHIQLEAPQHEVALYPPTEPPIQASGCLAVSVPIGGPPFQIPEALKGTSPEPPPAVTGVPSRWGAADVVLPQIAQAAKVYDAAAGAQTAYLRFAKSLIEASAETLAFQTTLLEALARRSSRHSPRVFLDRAGCLEFANGSIGKVLGPEFAPIDAHPTRVRLPDEPLLLVDRILGVDGEPKSLTGGRVVTQHDVQTGAWYLDGGRIPTCIAVEAGQADLFLSAYLGIDFQTRGLAVYRLLDAAVTFHSSLPEAGAVIQYDIHIDHFFRQGDTHLFRFRFEGSVAGKPLLSMTDGCAGFFTAEQLAAGGGVVRTELALRPRPGIRAAGEEDLPAMVVESYDEKQVDALRQGDLEAAFGPTFEGLRLIASLCLPGGRMRLVDRVAAVDPNGGRFGIGLIRAEADIHANDWFLTCHFVDDRVMAGTLMYECCLHTLRIFLLRLGWVTAEGDVVCEPVPGLTSRLKCRGQVTEATRTVTYEVALKERGYRPEPYALADALLYADGKPIVEINDMSVRLSGLTRQQVEDLWKRRTALLPSPLGGEGPGVRGIPSEAKTPHPQPLSAKGRGDKESSLSPEAGERGETAAIAFPRERILAFAIGKPSEAFGEPYRIFDEGRTVARLPGPPFSFLDRIVHVQGEPWKMAAGAEALAEYGVPPDAWYFAAERQAWMPLSVLLEVALQSCGWLAAYVGSALTSSEDLRFRNLGGEAVLHAPVGPDVGTLRTRARLTRVASSVGMILQHFDFEVRGRAGPVYSGTTSFGFFTKETLAQQVGIRDAEPYSPAEAERARGSRMPMPRTAPLPDDRLRMIDHLDLLVADGGPKGLGFVVGSKIVNPAEWFFKAHFYQDPVWPGSLGLESFLQLLKVLACQRWGSDSGMGFRLQTGSQHRWLYRGQVVPLSRRVSVQASVTARAESAGGEALTADGWLEVDGRVIYRMNDFTLVADCKEGRP